MSAPTVTRLRGMVLYLGRRHSPQFSDTTPTIFRVTRVREDWEPACFGWVWLDGYELDAHGDAVDKREVLVTAESVGYWGPEVSR